MSSPDSGMYKQYDTYVPPTKDTGIDTTVGGEGGGDTGPGDTGPGDTGPGDTGTKDAPPG
jgi:hypothetical protein